MTAHPEQLGPMIVEERPRPIFRAGERDDLDVEVRLLRERQEPHHGDAAFRRRQVESAVVHRQRPDDGEPQMTPHSTAFERAAIVSFANGAARRACIHFETSVVERMRTIPLDRPPAASLC
jgi:hypothetical protein